MQPIGENRQSIRHVRLAAVISYLAAWPVSAQPMGERVTGRNILIDTHINPSAGRLIVLSRDRTPVTELPGWPLAVAADDVVVYHRNSTHFAPTHSVEVSAPYRCRVDGALEPSPGGPASASVR